MGLILRKTFSFARGRLDRKTPRFIYLGTKNKTYLHDMAFTGLYNFYIKYNLSKRSRFWPHAENADKQRPSDYWHYNANICFCHLDTARDFIHQKRYKK